MPKRAGKGGRGKGGKKKRKGRDWYTEDFDPVAARQRARDEAAAEARRERKRRKRRAAAAAAAGSDDDSSDGEGGSSDYFSDSGSSDAESAYDALVASAKQIAAASSAAYAKLITQQRLEEDGKDESSDESSDDDDGDNGGGGLDSDSDGILPGGDSSDGGGNGGVDMGENAGERAQQRQTARPKQVAQRDAQRHQQEQEQEQEDDDDDEEGADGDEDEDADEDIAGAQDLASNASASAPEPDVYLTRFQAADCDEQQVRRALAARQRAPFTKLTADAVGMRVLPASGTAARDPLDLRWQSPDPYPPARANFAAGYRLKPRVASRWAVVQQAAAKKNRHRRQLRNAAGLTPLQETLFPALNAYSDLVFTDRRLATPAQKREGLSGSADELRELLALHIVNHVTKARDAVSNNTAHIRRWRETMKQERNAKQISRAIEADGNGTAAAAAAAARSGKSKKRRRKEDNKRSLEAAKAALAGKTPLRSLNAVDVQASVDGGATEGAASNAPPEHRDQGLSRCKVLVVLPTRACAERFVRTVLSLLPRAVKTVHSKKRFDMEYGLPELADMASEDPAMLAERDAEVQAVREQTRDGRRRPEDWCELFARNDNDCFTLGMAFSRKEIKLYSDFNSSDVIVASPLGLRVAMGAEGDDEKGKLDADFLSSIEVLVVDQAEALEMQNWEHLRSIMRRLNCTPRNERAQAVDFSRVRELDLLNLGRYFRQSIVLASHRMPALSQLVSQYCTNFTGVLRVQRAAYQGSIEGVVPRVRQLFRRIDGDGGLEGADEDRYQFFVQNMFPRLRRICRGLDAEEELLFSQEKEQGTIIFVPSYFDFLRIQNLFVAEGLNPAICCEYTKPGEQTRARSMFFHGKKRIMLYTERNHFYHRFRIRGARHIIFYAPPVHAGFYPDLLNVLSTSKIEDGDGATDPSVTVLFNKYDMLRVQRIAGSGRAKRMVKGKGGKTTYLFT